MKEIQEFIEVMEKDASSPLMNAIPEARDWHKTIMTYPSYLALKAKGEAKPDHIPDVKNMVKPEPRTVDKPDAFYGAIHRRVDV